MNKIQFFGIRLHLVVLCLIGSCLAPCGQAQLIDDTQQPQGLQKRGPDSYALVGAKLVIGDGRTIEQGTILVQSGKIASLGAAADVEVPAGWATIDVTGKTIYPGLIDAYRSVPVEPAAIAQSYWNPRIRPEVDMSSYLTDGLTDDTARRGQGIVAALFAPTGAIIDGTGVVASLGGIHDNSARRIVQTDVGQHGMLTVIRGARGGADSPGGGYPSSPMGAVALARQAMLDAKWYREAWQVVQVDASVPLPETNQALESLQGVLDGQRRLFVQTSNELAALRADRFAREFGVGLCVVGSGREYRRLDEVAATGRSIICPLNFPSAPNVATVAQSHAVTLESLLHWDHAPENPARLAGAQVKIAFTTQGLETPNVFLRQVRVAVERGLEPAAALRALTLNAAELLGVQEQLGTLARGKLASFIVTDGDLFQSSTKIEQTWVAGKPYDIKPAASPLLEGTWEVQVGAIDPHPAWSVTVEVKRRGEQWTITPKTSESEKAETSKEDKETDTVTEQAIETEEEADTEEDVESEQEADKEQETDIERKTDTEQETDKEQKSDNDQSTKTPKAPGVKFDRIRLDGAILSGTTQGSELPAKGVSRWNVVIDHLESKEWFGRWVWADGTAALLTWTRPEEVVATEEEAEEKEEEEAKEAAAESPPKDAQEEGTRRGRGRSSEDKKVAKQASFPVNYPLGMYGTESLPAQADSVLFKNFTVWTSGPDGILEGGSVWVQNGLIQQVFPDASELDAVEFPEGTTIVEGNGRHLAPGMIDCHSHAATDSGVNEGSQAVTAEVRIGDFIDCNDITIYRQLAGGLTAANILHGSANPIGGQNQVIKLRWGANDEQLKFQEAPPGIKFALGENVKRSNSTQPGTRYPGSRMGVEQIIRDAFYNATEYRLRHRQWAVRRDGLPPRVDLELEALTEIIEKRRWIHCHSYRQDEILALIRTLDEFHVQIGTFQHILEGYKVADSMAHHGAMASAFADWWAYKLEVADAIPYAGAIMHEQGVVVSFNSDDGELGRRMNHEAAKAVKYGGVSPSEALKFVTLNPAKQLRVDQYVGSLEVGKHADIVVWTGSPLSTLSRVDQSWIDGRCYFDRERDQQRQQELAKQKQQLIQKILDSGSPMAAPGEEIDSDSSRDWPRYDEFCGAKG